MERTFREDLMKLTIAARLWTSAFLVLIGTAAPATAQRDADRLATSATEHAMAMKAKLLCSVIFVEGRNPEVHVPEDLRQFPHFGGAENFE